MRAGTRPAHAAQPSANGDARPRKSYARAVRAGRPGCAACSRPRSSDADDDSALRCRRRLRRRALAAPQRDPSMTSSEPAGARHEAACGGDLRDLSGALAPPACRTRRATSAADTLGHMGDHGPTRRPAASVNPGPRVGSTSRPPGRRIGAAAIQHQATVGQRARSGSRQKAASPPMPRVLGVDLEPGRPGSDRRRTHAQNALGDQVPVPRRSASPSA